MTVSLCQQCAHRRDVVTGKGARFLLCTKAMSDQRYEKYPPQPIVRCTGFEFVQSNSDESDSIESK